MKSDQLVPLAGEGAQLAQLAPTSTIAIGGLAQLEGGTTTPSDLVFSLPLDKYSPLRRQSCQLSLSRA
jgi:hypothetical protein